MRTLIVLVIATGFIVDTAFAGEDNEAPVMQAQGVEEAPALDGDVLNDAVWQAIAPSSGFTQTQPDEGSPASERTEVRVLFTQDMLYIGVVCHDREPGRIVIADSRRDASLSQTDSFRFILDTYNDNQNGFVFGTNPAGIEYDAQVTNEARGGFGNARQQGGAVGGFNINWDGAWDVRTSVGDYGWSAEFAIPFRTLRFPRQQDQTWGINFQRTIPRNQENVFWAPLPRQFDLNRVSLAGSITGLNVPDPRNLKIIPYALGSANRDFETDDELDGDGDFGVDVKYSVTPSLTLDLTYNTDFAQVEVDEQQINLDRFSLFFPEKRPFFLENAGVFSVGESGEVDLFFSRRIGIGTNGVNVPIVGGARLTGNVGGMQVGLVNMQTESVKRADVPGNNFSVARVKRELPNRSAIGVLVTNREGTGDLAGTDDYNRLVAVDGELGIGEFAQVRGFASRSFSPGFDDDEYAFNLLTNYNSEAWLLQTSYTQVGENFNPEIGFLRREAYRKATGLIFYRYRPTDFLGFHELRPHISWSSYWGLDGFHETNFLHIDNHWEWESGYEIHTGVNFTREGVRDAFEISDGVIVPTGTYDHSEAMLVGFTDRSEWISLSMRAFIGGFFGGDRVSLRPSLTIRLGDTFNTEFSVSHNNIDLPGGSFTTNLLRARLSYSFTPRVYLQSLLQYNDQADIWSMNLRFGWLQAANTGLFLVYNQTNDIDGIPLNTLNRSFVLKYTYLFDVYK